MQLTLPCYMWFLSDFGTCWLDLLEETIQSNLFLYLNSDCGFGFTLTYTCWQASCISQCTISRPTYGTNGLVKLFISKWNKATRLISKFQRHAPLNFRSFSLISSGDICRLAFFFFSLPSFVIMSVSSTCFSPTFITTTTTHTERNTHSQKLVTMLLG